jgi:hypothetical protein
MHAIGRTVVTSAFALAVLAFAAPGAAATDVSCGQEITSAGVYTFSRDLSCTEPIRITTTGVTLDLKGHTLSGDGEAFAGIIVWTYLGAPADPVVIANGTIRGFMSPFGGALFLQSSGVTMRHLTITHNLNGVHLYSRDSGCCVVRLENSVVAGNQTGVLARPGTVPEIVNNTIVRNYTGIFASQTSGGYFRSNLVALNANTGIAVNDGPPVVGNLVVHNGGNGVTITGPGTQSPYWVVTGNVAVGNGGYGIWAEFPVGEGGGNRAYGNGSTPQCWNVLCSPH